MAMPSRWGSRSDGGRFVMGDLVAQGLVAGGRYDLRGRRVWVAGHRGMVGGAVLRRLGHEGCTILTAPRATLDLTEQAAVRDWMTTHRPDVVVLAAAHVGGIQANADFPVDFLYRNLMIQTNVLQAAHDTGVGRLLFLGSSCIYPRLAAQPMAESALLTGPLEPTNEAYAIAKIAGIRLTQAYRRQYGRDWIAAMPTNLYGPGDNYHPQNSHVLPALLRRFHQARLDGAAEVVIWGTGRPLREFMHCDDLADALVFLLKQHSGADHVNVGSGVEVSIRELAETVADVVGCTARLRFDASRPDGTPRKLMDSSSLHALGWNRCRDLRTGIADAYRAFLAAEVAPLPA